MSHPKTAIALLSSGLDSSVAMAMAIKEGYRVAMAVTYDYGQRAHTRELLHSGWISNYFKVPHRTIHLSWLGEMKGSHLLKRQSGEVLPQPGLADLDNLQYAKQSAEAVWVPNRNGVMIEIGASIAEDLKADTLIVGFNREEAATFPDNSENYILKINEALSFSTRGEIKVISPTQSLNKTEIVKKAKEIHFPLELVWSCYEAGSLMCGTCESCMRLKRALKQNEVNLSAQFADPSL